MSRKKRKKKLKLYTKKKAQQLHARRRLRTRWGLYLNHYQIREMINAIQSGNPQRARKVDERSYRLSRWLVRYGDLWLPCAYDRTRKEIVTFFPSDSLNKFKAKAETYARKPLEWNDEHTT